VLGRVADPLRTDAGIQGRDGAVRLRAALRATFSTIVLIWADGGYAGRLVRRPQTVLALTGSIVKRTDDHLPPAGPVRECQDAFRDDAADTRP
jgi:hypothetical protein